MTFGVPFPSWSGRARPDHDRKCRKSAICDPPVAALMAYSTDIHSLGLETAAGLRLSESYYWDLNDPTQSFQNRI